jgi:hypothetical protein
MFPTTLLTTLLFALSVAASPVLVNRSPVTLPLSRRFNLTSIHNLVRHDQARAKALRARATAMAAGLPFHSDTVINSGAENRATSYIASVGVGSPATNCKHYFFFFRILSLYLLDLEIDDLIIDTGRYALSSPSLLHPNSSWYKAQTLGSELTLPTLRLLPVNRLPTQWCVELPKRLFFTDT